MEEIRMMMMSDEGLVMMTGIAVVAATTIGVAMVMCRERNKKRNVERRKQCLDILSEFAQQCATPVPLLWSVAHDLSSSLRHRFSLSSSSSSDAADQPLHPSPLNAVVSYVAPLPTGEETGWFYGVNVRGTSLLIWSARLTGRNEPISHVNREELPMPSSVMDATSQDILFNHIATELAAFINRHEGYVHDNNQDGKRILGFTFTYPPDQAKVGFPCCSLNWKNLSFDDREAKDIVDGINKALDKHGLNMQVFSVLDDTVGELAGGRYYNNDSIVAVNLGMGTNAAYVQQAEAVGISPTSGELVVTVDWGSFKSSHLPVTEYDKSLDSESFNPGCRIFEKLVSGKYLGEIVRKVLLEMAQQTDLFGHKVPPKLSRPNLLRPIDIAAMHQDTSEDREVIDEKLSEVFGISNSTPMARELVAEVCDIVVERGARLAGAGIVGIMKKLERIKTKKSVVIVQGTLYEDYRVFRNYLHSSVWEMLELELSNNVVIQPGSGAGPLFLAASQPRIS